MEARALIAEPLLPRAQGAEVLGCFGYDVGVELEYYPRRRT